MNYLKDKRVQVFAALILGAIFGSHPIFAAQVLWVLFLTGLCVGIVAAIHAGSDAPETPDENYLKAIKKGRK